MKRTAFLLIIFLVPVVMVMGQGRKVKPQTYDLFDQTISSSNGLRVSKVEVSNKEYKAFLMGLIEENKAHLIPEYAPDVTVWEKDLGFNDPYTQYYFSHPAFDDYPVVGITHKAASAYCEWMTRHFSEMPAAKKGKDMVSYEFRLPSEEEWMAAAEIGSPSRDFWPGGFVYPRNRKGKFLFNHKLGTGDFAGFAGGHWKDFEGYMITAPVKTFYADDLELYNVAGNAAEMVAEKGIAKGGSWYHLAEKCKINSDLSYDAPESWLGFRFVVERVD